MQVTKTNVEIIKQLQFFNISTKMRSLESSDWIVYEQIDDKIMGAAGMGGLFHSSSINVHEKFRGKGLGKKIQIELVKEAKRKNFSFVTVFVDSRNASSQKMHDEVGYKTIFIKRADEWGKEGPPDPIPNKHHDLILDSFTELKEALKC